MKSSISLVASINSCITGISGKKAISDSEPVFSTCCVSHFCSSHNMLRVGFNANTGENSCGNLLTGAYENTGRDLTESACLVLHPVPPTRPRSAAQYPPRSRLGASTRGWCWSGRRWCWGACTSATRRPSSRGARTGRRSTSSTSTTPTCWRRTARCWSRRPSSATPPATDVARRTPPDKPTGWSTSSCTVTTATASQIPAAGRGRRRYIISV